jgi:hypothetical protein
VRRRTLLVLLSSLAIVLICAIGFVATRSGSASPSLSSCGSELWSLKTLADPGRQLVRLRPRNTTVAAINRLRMPVLTPATRSTVFQRRVWRVKAQIVQYKLEADSDIHLILFAGGAYMIAEMPSPACLSRKTRVRAAIAAVRTRFEGRCGMPSSQWQFLGAVAYVSGVGFWDFPHGQAGHARNYSELHPVTGMRLVAGCGA